MLPEYHQNSITSSVGTFACSLSLTASLVSASRIERISLPVLPLDSREMRTCLDIITKKSVENCVFGEGAPSSLILASVLVLGACLVYTHTTGVGVNQKSNTSLLIWMTFTRGSLNLTPSPVVAFPTNSTKV